MKLKHIVLVNGRGIATLDVDDALRLGEFRWYYVKGYARRVVSYTPQKVWRYMHQDVLMASAGLEVDHINGKPLDNRKCNLRLVDRTRQMWNQRKKAPTYVSWDKARCLWAVRVKRAGVIARRRFASYLAARRWAEKQRRLLEEKYTLLGGTP